MVRTKTIRRYSSLNQVEDGILNYLRAQYSERDVELYIKWYSGVPLTTIMSAFSLRKQQVHHIVKALEERIDSCFAWHRIQALFELTPLEFGTSQGRRIHEQMDSALAKVVTLKADSLASDEAFLRTVIRHDERESEFYEGDLSVRHRPQKLEIVRESRTPLNDLGLSCRAYNVVSSKGARTIEELCKLTRQQVLSERNCGQRTIEEIERALSERGFSLKVDQFELAN